MMHPVRRRARFVSQCRTVFGAGLICAFLLGQGGSASVRATSDLGPGAIVSRGGLSAVVPWPGESVGAEAWLAGGGSISLRVETRLDGRVVITALQTPAHSASPRTSSAGNPNTPDATILASPPPCVDRAHHLTGSWWRARLDWSFRGSSRPSYLSRSAARSAVKAGAAHITRSFNDCGRSDRVSATSRFLGGTTVAPNIGSNSSCRNPDGHNVVGFGDLLGAQLGLTCWWFRGTRTIEADIKLNRHDFRWATTTAGCTNQYMIEAVATHEFGHAFGLGHVSEADHGNLTMSTNMLACDNSPSTLGLGDMLALETRY